MTLARTSYPPRMLYHADTRSQAPCVAEIGALLGANLTTHKGHSSGGVLIGDTPNSAPLNPSGDYGHDHSGGEYGRAIFRSIATLDFGGGAYGSNMLVGPRAYAVEHEAVAASVPTLVGGGTFRIWVPPCDPAIGVGAYAALASLSLVEIVSTALRAADVVTLQLLQVTPRAPSAEVSIELDGDPSSTGYLQGTSDAGELLPTLPGAFNTIQWRILVDREGAGSPRGALFRLDDLELGVFST